MKLVFYNGAAINEPKIGVDYSIDNNIATIKGEPNISGFYFENYGVKIGEEFYSKFKTLYRNLEDGRYQLSNDGSVYVPPQPEPQPEPHVFTHTPILLNEVEYDALDYNNFVFYLPAADYDFTDVYEITVGGVTYTDIKYEGMTAEVIDEVEYIRVNFRELTELERQVALNTSNIDYISMVADIEL